MGSQPRWWLSSSPRQMLRQMCTRLLLSSNPQVGWRPIPSGSCPDCHSCQSGFCDPCDMPGHPHLTVQGGASDSPSLCLRVVTVLCTGWPLCGMFRTPGASPRQPGVLQLALTFLIQLFSLCLLTKPKSSMASTPKGVHSTLAHRAMHAQRHRLCPSLANGQHKLATQQMPKRCWTRTSHRSFRRPLDF